MNTKNDKAFKVFHLKADKSLSIYIDSKNSKVYQARIYIPKQRRYITRSTRTNDVRLAEERAFSIYEELLNNRKVIDYASKEYSEMNDDVLVFGSKN